MYKVSVMYPTQKNGNFDVDYYCTKHLELVEKYMKPFGLIRFEILKGISGGGDSPPPFAYIGNMYFETGDGYEKAIAASKGVLRNDVPNFTNITPMRQISEILTESVSNGS
jgi:uncharacterized protein (TIGR02118 family)